MDMARYEFEVGQKNGLTPDQIQANINKAWDSADNRMGQLVYDNLFWNHTLKDIGMIAVRSLGWNVGTVRELGGGVKDAATGNFSHRAAYTVALPIQVAILGGIIHYLYNGQGPQEIKDYFMPKTGRKLPNGEDERVQIASYMKDVTPLALAASRAGSIPGAVAAIISKGSLMALHKASPWISAVGEAITNKDFYGTMIRNPNDPFTKQVGELADFALKTAMPFSFRNAQKRMETGGNASAVAESFAGITPVPSTYYQTPFEEAVNNFSRGRQPVSGYAKDEMQKFRSKGEIMGQLRRAQQLQDTGDTAGYEKTMKGVAAAAQTARQNKWLNDKDMQDIEKNWQKDPAEQRFSRLTFDQKTAAWEKANQDERKQYADDMEKAVQKQIESDPENADQLLADLQKRFNK